MFFDELVVKLTMRMIEKHVRSRAFNRHFTAKNIFVTNYKEISSSRLHV